MEHIQSVTMELRPRLQICNAFIHIGGKIEPNEVEIKLLEKCVTLVLKNKSFNLSLDCISMIPSSASALSVINNWISFRVQTKSDPSFGSFTTEILANRISVPPILDSTTNKKQQFSSVNCNIMCSCCKNHISKAIMFQRILPLPDVDYDPNEWFCCKHSHGNISTQFSPQTTDLFYAPFFSVVNSSIFTTKICLDSDALVCNRCFQYLGNKHTSDSYKLWNSSVDYQSLDFCMIQPATDPLNDFLLAFQSSVSGMFGEEIVLHHTTRKENHYLFIKPMDWNLCLITESKNTDEQADYLCLQKMSVVKVLYKYRTKETDITAAAFNLKFCDVSLQMLEAGFKYLLSSTKRFPEAHRHASGYYIGHVQLKKIECDTKT